MKTQRGLIIAVCILAAVLAGLLCFLFLYRSPAAETAATEPTVPAVKPAETTAPPTTAPTEPPEKVYKLTFVGDCTLANGSNNSLFTTAMAGDYTYPFRGVREYFMQDECTFINLECAMSDRGAPEDKLFTFRAPTDHVNIMTKSGVEVANVVNNHSHDFGEDAFGDTKQTLQDAGIHFADQWKYTVFTTKNGLTIGFYADMFPHNTNGLKEKIAAMRAQGAQIVVVCYHWGEENVYDPTAEQESIARKAIDAGADIVYGHHPHVLQKTEIYNGKPIFYSLGNFSFGGNGYPKDYDTALIQVPFTEQEDGSLKMGELITVPCSLSSVTDRNDFQPTPLKKTDGAYERVLSKLAGTSGLDRLPVPYLEETEEETEAEPEETEEPIAP